MPTPRAAPAEQTSALQQRLVQDIAAHIRDNGLASGAILNQLSLSRQFGVSRTPVKAALETLSQTGLVAFDTRGVRVHDPRVKLDIVTAPDAVDTLLVAIAHDLRSGRLSGDASESDLMRRYQVTRGSITGALRRLADLGLAIRKPGFGWRFLDADGSDAARMASNRFRQTIEPAALREPGFRADPQWIAAMSAFHLRYLERRWRASHAVAFFEMNAQFHLELVGFAGNRFFTQATAQQIALRRLRNYSWGLGAERVRVSCTEHLGVLEALSQGDVEMAADRLARHIAGAMQSEIPG